MMDLYILGTQLAEIMKDFGNKEYTEQNTQDYFEKTLQQMDKYFRNRDWNEEYMFCSMGYSDHNKTTLINYRYGWSCLEYINKLMRKLTEEQINKHKALSITQMFLHEENWSEHYKALFYSCHAPETIETLDDFIYINLNNYNWELLGTPDQFWEYNFKQHHYGSAPWAGFRKRSNGKSPLEKMDVKAYPAGLDTEFNKLLSVYLEIAAVMKKEEKDCFFYFLKPVSFQEHYNIVLLLGLSKPLQDDEIAIWLKHTSTIQSIIVERKLQSYEKQKAETTLLRSISACTHIMKTSTNFLLSAPLNSLAKEMRSDPRIEELLEAKDILLMNTNLINLVSKLSSKNDHDEDAIARSIKALTGSELFQEEFQPVNLSKCFNRRVAIWNKYNGNKHRITWINAVDELLAPPDFLVYKGLCAAESFYDILILTIIENCDKHAWSRDYEIKLEITLQKDQLVFENRPKSTNSSGQEYLVGTGNLFTLSCILEYLVIGAIKMRMTDDKFQTIVQNNH